MPRRDMEGIELAGKVGMTDATFWLGAEGEGGGVFNPRSVFIFNRVLTQDEMRRIYGVMEKDLRKERPTLLSRIRRWVWPE